MIRDKNEYIPKFMIVIISVSTVIAILILLLILNKSNDQNESTSGIIDIEDIFEHNNWIEEEAVEEIYKGAWFYREGTFNNEEIIQIPFRMNVKIYEGIFKGTSEDEETKDIFDEPVKVRGFIEGNHISFIKTYPKNYELLEDGTPKVIKNSGPHEVTYDGSWDPKTQNWKGEWEVLLGEEKVGDAYDMEFYMGDWELKKLS